MIITVTHRELDVDFAKLNWVLLLNRVQSSIYPDHPEDTKIMEGLKEKGGADAQADANSKPSSSTPPTEPPPTIPIMELLSFKIFTFVSDDEELILKNAKLAYVFGNTGIIVTTDDEVYSIGEYGGTEENAVSLTKITILCGKSIREFIAGNSVFCLALTAEGEIYSWGYNYEGRLGLGDKEHSREPKLVQGELVNKKVVQVVASGTFVLALTDGGAVHSWGNGNKGQLGLGDTNSRVDPQPILQDYFEGQIITAIAVAREWSVALSQSGQLYHWGSGVTRPKALPAPGVFKKVVSGLNSIFALSEKGEVYEIKDGEPHARKAELEHYVVDLASDSKVAMFALEHYHGIVCNGGFGGGIATSNSIRFASLDEAFAVRAQISYRTLTPPDDKSFRELSSVRGVADDISRAWSDGLNQDVTFFVEDKKIGANKTILCLRSPYFEKMFSGNSNWKETSSDSSSPIVIKDTTYDAFASLLFYIYNGQLDVYHSDYEDIFDIMQLADSYCEFGIRRTCESILMGHINKDNALFLLKNSVAANATDLEQRVIQYAVNHGKEIMELCPNPGELENKLGKEAHDKLVLAYMRR